MDIEIFLIYNIILDYFMKNKIVDLVDNKICLVKLQAIKRENNLMLLF